MARESIQEKGVRLAKAGKVGEPIDATMYPVEGDTGLYFVVVAEGRVPLCTCPTHGRCSHVYSVAHERAFGGHVYAARP